MTKQNDVLTRLADLLEERKQADPDGSYVASLYAKGLDAVLKKVAEEGGEFIMAAKDEVPEKVVYEAADLCFHTLVALAALDVRPEQVLSELERRFGLSGLA